MPIYQYECRVAGHTYEGLRPLDTPSAEGCEVCWRETGAFAFAHRIVGAASVHIPGRAVARKFAEDTFKFTAKATRDNEARARKPQWR